MGVGRISDKELAKYVPAEDVRTFTAPKGTLIFCNTSGLHRGGFAEARPRVLAAATYCSPASLASLTERNYSLQRRCPGKRFHYVANENCNCSECPYMKLNTLEKLRDCLLNLEPRVELSDELIRRALVPLERMLAIR